MQIILFAKSFAGCSADEIGEAAKRAGFEGLDIPIRNGQCITPGNVQSELPRAMRLWHEMGLKVPLVSLEGFHTDPDDEGIRRIYQACAHVGVSFVKLGYWPWEPGQNYWQSVDKIRRDLEGFQMLSEQHKVCSLVHVHSGNLYGSNANGVMHLVKEFDPRLLAVYLDPAHLATDGESTPMAVSVVGDYLRMFGVKNVRFIVRENGGWTKQWCRLAEGLVDWREVMSTLHDVGYNNPLSFHAEYDAPHGHPTPRLNKNESMSVATEDLKYLRDIISTS